MTSDSMAALAIRDLFKAGLLTLSEARTNLSIIGLRLESAQKTALPTNSIKGA